MDRSAGEDLARIADELLEHTRALRRQHEELRDALAGVAPVAVSEPINGRPPPRARERENGERGVPDNLQTMALQMCLAGETREAVKEQLRALEIDARADDVVDEVFDRVETQRSEGRRRRLFTRRGR